jgi:HlyD family secretion protein
MGLINKKTIAAAVVVLLILAVFAVLRFQRGGIPGISYNTAQVGRHNILSQITATGTINPITTIEVGTQVSGVISNLYVDYNSEVKKEEPLAEIDQSLFETKLKLAEIDNKKAQSEYNTADSLYTTNKELYKNTLIPKEELEKAQARYSSARAAYEQSKAALEIAQSNLNNTVIRSPIGGTVLTRNVNVGQTIVPNSQPLFVVAESLARMKLDANVNEVNIGKVETGQKVNFTVEAYPNKIFHGTVSQVINDPVITNNIVTFSVVVQIENEERMLKPGMTAAVNIIVADEKDVLTVPTAALRFIPLPSASITAKPDDAYGDSHVWILLKDGRIAPVSVKTGMSDDTYSEITKGDIKEGQDVIVESSSDNDSKISNTYLPQPGRF